jgi:hypothetical protein
MAVGAALLVGAIMAAAPKSTNTGSPALGALLARGVWAKAARPDRTKKTNHACLTQLFNFFSSSVTVALYQFINQRPALFSELPVETVASLARLVKGR